MARPASKDVKVAMPVADGVLCPRFGQGQRFAIIHILDGRISTAELHEPPSREPEGLPRWVAEFGVDLVIADGMGEPARGFFTERGIEVITGAPRLDPQRLIQSYCAGTLGTGPAVSDH